MSQTPRFIIACTNDPKEAGTFNLFPELYDTKAHVEQVRDAILTLDANVTLEIRTTDDETVSRFYAAIHGGRTIEDTPSQTHCQVIGYCAYVRFLLKCPSPTIRTRVNEIALQMAESRRGEFRTQHAVYAGDVLPSDISLAVEEFPEADRANAYLGVHSRLQCDDYYIHTAE